MRRIIFLGLVLFLSLAQSQAVFARENIRELFRNNQAIIYTINIRNFASVDKNFNGIIDLEDGDTKGTFLNAKDKLKTLKAEGINTIYVLPITSVGKLKALGTAGSLYAMDEFDKINPQLDDETNKLSVFEEAKAFVDEAHRLGMFVIVDLPSCGSYDMSLRKPHWFISSESKESFVPSDWTDVRLFKIYNDDNTLYKENIENFKKFVDMAQSLGFDGIRADVAAIKPYEFWKEIIDYARSKNKDFLFLAEAAIGWTNPTNGAQEQYSSVEELLKAGFDSYYGSWSDFKNIKTKEEFDEKLDKSFNLLKKYDDKSIIASFATHDQQAPILRGFNYWNMILWLSATLPINTYYLDGFSIGDDFTYDYENMKAKTTYTDDEYYYVHSGLFDIFNLAAPTTSRYPKIKKYYIKAVAFKKENADLISFGKFKTLKTNNEKVFAYTIVNSKKELIVVGSLDEENNQNVVLASKYADDNNLFSVLSGKIHPKINKKEISANLEPLELQVFLINRVNSQEY